MTKAENLPEEVGKESVPQLSDEEIDQIIEGALLKMADGNPVEAEKLRQRVLNTLIESIQYLPALWERH